MAEQERELVVDGALPVVQVGVADPARLDRDPRLPRPRIGDHDRLDRHGQPLGPSNDTLHLNRHVAAPEVDVPATAATLADPGGRSLAR